MSIYRDFLEFLKKLSGDGDPWELYTKCYLNPHRDFLLSYWESFPLMGLDQVRQRVERIKRSDYANLQSLLLRENPEAIVGGALRRCEAVFPAPEEPDTYLIVGFFSSEGFVIQYKGKPVVGMGLERFKDFRSLGLIFAHEYCHYLRSLTGKRKDSLEKRNLGETLLSEGLSVLFSQLVFPERTLPEHLLISRARLNWCITNEEWLKSLVRSELDSRKQVSVLFNAGSEELDIPPRVGHYIGYSLLKEHQVKTGETLAELLKLDRLPDG